jgi:hypothetical protein
MKVEVFRSDPSATRSFFTASIQPIHYTPTFPFNSSWLGYLGLSTHLLQPPLPAGEPADVVVKTEGWKRSNPVLKTSKAKLVWVDMNQPDGSKSAGSGAAEGDALLGKNGPKNWWPGMKRWHVGLYCPDSTLELGEPDVLPN